MPEPTYQPDFDVDAAVHGYFAQRATEPPPPPRPATAATIDSGRAKWTAWLRTQPLAALEDWWTRFRAAADDGAARAAATLQEWAAEVDLDALGLSPRQAVGWWLRLGDALGQPTAGPPPVWLQWRAIACYEAALRLLNEAATGDPTTARRDVALPREWALAQVNLGSAWLYLEEGDLAVNARHAITCASAALGVLRADEHARFWAWAQHVLGAAWRMRPDGERATCWRNALACYEAVTQALPEAEQPREWARAQRDLARTWRELPDGDPATNLRHAADHFAAAARGFAAAGLADDAEDAAAEAAACAAEGGDT